MNLTCSYCQTPFTLGIAQKVAALQRMHAENLNHYDAHCPRCGRANAVSRERLQMFTPGWQEAIKQSTPESASASSPELSAPEPPTPLAKPEAKKPAKKAAKVEPKKTANKTTAKKTKHK
ncbi:MAG: hypothetical protein WBW94_17580 [Anaerolineales bacterium]